MSRVASSMNKLTFGQRKIASKRGESLAEALVSVLIITLVFVFLTTAVVSAARVNDSIKAGDVSLDIENVQTSGVKVSIGGATVDATLCTAQNDDGAARYYYYEYNATS